MPSNLPFDLPTDHAELLKLGKLRFHKSGKVTLRIQNQTNGKIDLVVKQGISNSFYQELVNLTTASDGKSHHLSFLSKITDKLVVTPDFDALLRE